MSDNRPENVKPEESSLSPNRPYTIHLWFPAYQGGYEYLLRHVKWREGERTESGYVVEPIGTERDDAHKVLLEYSIRHEYWGRHHWGFCVDKLHKMATLVTRALHGRIVAINEPDRPALPDPDLTPY